MVDKREIIRTVILGILLLPGMILPVAAGLMVMSGAPITSTTGETELVVVINDTDLAINSTITLDVTSMQGIIASGVFTADNIQVNDSAVNATWTSIVDGNTLTLTSTEGNTTVGETVTITFTGAQGNPWIPDTSGKTPLYLFITRTDTAETEMAVFPIDIIPPAVGLSITDGEKITTRTGETAEVITIIDSDLPENSTITIDIEPLQYGIVASGVFTEANVLVNDTAVNATWMGAVDGNTLTMTSVGGNTTVGESVTITFTGAKGSPWVQDTGGEWPPYALLATRMDTGDTATFHITIVTSLDTVGSLTTEVSGKISSTEGNASVTLTVTGTPIFRYDGIILDISPLHPYVSNGTFSADNLEVTDTAVSATWNGTLVGDTLRLSAGDGTTEVGETIIVTLTGAKGNPWVSDTQGLSSVTLYLVREDNFAPAEFTIELDIARPAGFGIEEGAPITTADGNSTFVLTVTDTEVPMDNAITIDIALLQGPEGIVAIGTLKDANVLINDTAANATWTRDVEGDTLTLTSTEGNTTVGETVTVTFTGGEGNSWVPNTHGVRQIPLTATRSDILSLMTFNFTIETAPPPGYLVVANFSAGSTVGIAPFTVTFTDLSLGHPMEWNWDFGDGETSMNQSPTHVYATGGVYSVSLQAANEYGSDSKTFTNYIHVGDVSAASTILTGLTISNGPAAQTVSVDTSFLTVILSSNNSVLEIDPPDDSGFSRIIFYALNGTSFSTGGSTITGQIRGVTLISADIAPTGGFSVPVGTEASFGYSIDLATYPTNAVLSTTIWEGEIPDYSDKLLNLTLRSSSKATPIGTAYTASITKTNFPPNATVTIRMSIDAFWSENIPNGPAPVFIWRIADDGYSGEVFNTTLQGIDPANNLAHFEANSVGLSTFGLSALTGNNSPYGMIAWAVKQVVSGDTGSGGSSGNGGGSSGNGGGSSGGGGGSGGGGSGSHTSSSPPPPSSTENVPSTAGPETPAALETEEIPVPPTTEVAPLLVPSGTGSLAFLIENPVLIAGVAGFLLVVMILEGKFHILRRKEHQYLGTPERGSAAVEGLLATDRQKALAEIIDMLTNVDDQLKALESTMAKRSPGFVFASEEADAIVGKFFYTCQVAGEKIKTAAEGEHISQKQIDHLNGQLRDAVDRMVAVTQKSDVLNRAVQGRLSTGTAAAGGKT